MTIALGEEKALGSLCGVIWNPTQTSPLIGPQLDSWTRVLNSVLITTGCHNTRPGPTRLSCLEFELRNARRVKDLAAEDKSWDRDKPEGSWCMNKVKLWGSETRKSRKYKRQRLRTSVCRKRRASQEESWVMMTVEHQSHDPHSPESNIPGTSQDSKWPSSSTLSLCVVQVLLEFLTFPGPTE